MHVLDTRAVSPTDYILLSCMRRLCRFFMTKCLSDTCVRITDECVLFVGACTSDITLYICSGASTVKQLRMLVGHSWAVLCLLSVALCQDAVPASAIVLHCELRRVCPEIL